MTTIVEKAPEGEVKEGVVGILAVLAACTVKFQRVQGVARPAALSDFIRVHGVEIGRVGSVTNFWNVRRFLAAQCVEVHIGEKGVNFDFAGTVNPEA